MCEYLCILCTHFYVYIFIDYARIFVYIIDNKSIKSIQSRRFSVMKMYKVYFEGQLIGIETFSTEEVREINNCDDIRVELITD